MFGAKLQFKALAGAAILAGCFGISSIQAADDTSTIVGTVSAKGDTWLGVKADGSDEMTMFMPVWKGGAPAQGGGFDQETLAKIKGIESGSKIRLTFKNDEHPRIVSVETVAAPEAAPEKPREVAVADVPKRKGDGDAPKKMREEDGPRKMRDEEPRRKGDGEAKHITKEAEDMGGERSGTFTGVVVGKGETYIEVQADPKSPAKRFMPRYSARSEGPDREVMKVMQRLKVNEWVKIDWTLDEHLRATRIIQNK